METPVSHVTPSGPREGLRGKESVDSEASVLEDAVRGTLNALKLRVRGERSQYVKSRLERNWSTLQQGLQHAEGLSRARDNQDRLVSSPVTASVDAAGRETSGDNRGLVLRSRLALFPANSQQAQSTGSIRRPQICSKWKPGNTNARKISCVDFARLEAVSRLPSCTAWMFVDRNERMTKDQSIARRRRISYDTNGGETFFCIDDEEEAGGQDDVEKTEETRALTASEEYISRLAILEHGSALAVLKTIADFVQVSVISVETLCQSLPAARLGINNNEKLGWQPVASMLSQIFRQPIHHGLARQVKSNGNFHPGSGHLGHELILSAFQANTSGNETVNAELTSDKEGEEEIDLPTTLALALDSFDTLFCRRCLIFNCALHRFLDEIVVGVNEIQPPSTMRDRDQTEPCSPGCRFLVSSSTSLSLTAPAATPATKRVCASRREFQRTSHLSSTSEINDEGGEEGHRLLPNGQLRAVDSYADDNEQTSVECDENTGLDISTTDGRLLESHQKKKRSSFLSEDRVKKLRKNVKKNLASEFLAEVAPVLPAKGGTMEDAESSSDSMPYKHESKRLNVPSLPGGDVLTPFCTTREGGDILTATMGDQNDGTRVGISEHRCPTDGNVIEVHLTGPPQPELPRSNKWNKLEQDLCEKGVQIFGKNSCLIAQNVLKGCKSCRQIYEYIRNQDNGTAAAGSEDESSSTAQESPNRANKFRSMKLLQQHSGGLVNRAQRPPKFRFGRKKVAPKFSRKRIGTGDGSAGALNALYSHYTPCGCESSAGCGRECPCALGNVHCEKYCGCFKVCKNRFQGCQCAKSMCDRRHCPCFAAGRECDPDVCKFCSIDCGHGKAPLQECNNMRILQRSKKRLLLAQSDVCTGWGVFTRSALDRNDYVGEYTGELISHGEADRRGRIYDRETSFLFNLNDKLVVDAFRKGNKLKFANHSSLRANCYAKVLLVGGDHRVAIFAKEKIEAGDELLYNYQYEPEIAPLWATKPG